MHNARTNIFRRVAPDIHFVPLYCEYCTVSHRLTLPNNNDCKLYAMQQHYYRTYTIHILHVLVQVAILLMHCHVHPARRRGKHSWASWSRAPLQPASMHCCNMRLSIATETSSWIFSSRVLTSWQRIQGIAYRLRWPLLSKIVSVIFCN